MGTTRRTFMQAAGWTILAPAISVAGRPALARAEGAEKSWRHGIAIFGDLKYPPGFAHFDYVNSAAPRGGTLRMSATGTFDNFNPVIAGLKGQLAAGTELIFETLATNSLDEEASEYGLIAEAVSFPEDRSSVSYRLRPEARWQDGRPITAEDVIYSFEVFKTNSPQVSAYYRHVTKAERTSEREVTFTFDRPNIRELPQIVGELTGRAEALVRGRRQGRAQAQRHRNVARSAARLGALPHQVISGRTRHRV